MYAFIEESDVFYMWDGLLYIVFSRFLRGRSLMVIGWMKDENLDEDILQAGGGRVKNTKAGKLIMTITQLQKHICDKCKHISQLREFWMCLLLSIRIGFSTCVYKVWMTVSGRILKSFLCRAVLFFFKINKYSKCFKNHYYLKIRTVGSYNCNNISWTG